MATQVPTLGELLCVDELESKLNDLSEQVKLKKEEVRSNFYQLHSLLSLREEFLLREMDNIVQLARQEMVERKESLKELFAAGDGLERDLAQNKLKKILEKNLHVLEAEIGEQVAKGVSVCWMELEWKREELEQSVIEVCKVVSLRERPVTQVDYSMKLRPVWSHDGTISGEISYPRQIAIDDVTQNIFVADCTANIVQVFDGEGNHLYKISTPLYPIGIALTDEYVYVSTDNRLILKIDKSSNKHLKSVQTENDVFGVETSSTNTHLYVCEYHELSVIVYDRDLEYLKRIQLKSAQANSDTRTYSVKLRGDTMYVMFGHYSSSPPFYLQIFTLEGELVRSLVRRCEVVWSYFFSIDPLGNIIVTDCEGNRIRIFSTEGAILHTITSDMLPGDQEFDRPAGVAIDKQNRIVLAHKNNECNLLAF